MHRLALAGLIAFSLAGCLLAYDTDELAWPEVPDASTEPSDGGGRDDAGTIVDDAGVTSDAGATIDDAGTLLDDAGTVTIEDAGTTTTDDAGTPLSDAGQDFDAGGPDGGLPSSCDPACSADKVCFIESGSPQCLASFSQSNLRAVSGTSITDVWAVGYNEVFHWNGQDWRKESSPPDAPLFFNSVLAVSPSRVYLGTTDNISVNGEIHEWNGTSWTKTWGGTAADGRGVLALASNGTGHIAVGTAGLVVQLPGTVLSSPPGGSDLMSVAFTAPSSGSLSPTLFAATRGKVFMYETAWTTHLLNADDQINSMDSAEGTIWGVGENGLVVNTDGLTWIAETPAIFGGSSLRGVWAQSPTEAWIATSNGYQGRVAHCQRGPPTAPGISCTAEYSSSEPLIAIWGAYGAGGLMLFAVGDGGTVRHMIVPSKVY